MPDLTLPDGPISDPNIYTIEFDDRGAAVYGVQRSLNRCGLFDTELNTDGIYGEKTQNRVRKYQQKRDIDDDGKFGPQTTENMCLLLQDLALEGKVLPGGILGSLIFLESGNYIAANNWSVPGGVDLSWAQRRVYEPYEDDAVKRAFDGLYQFKLVANTLRGRHDAYYGSTGAPTHEKAWRLAVLYHNYQSGAAKIAEVGISGLSSYWTTPQEWVTSKDRHFDDGAPVQTPLEWCKHYALGAPEHNHEGVAVRSVTNWNVA